MSKFYEYTVKHPENRQAKFFKKVIQRKLRNCKIESLGIVSCQNPDPIMGVSYTEEDNARAVKEMEVILQKRHFKYLKVNGIYKGEGEVSFIIADISKDEIEHLSNLNYQKSYIWGKVEEQENGKNFLGLYMRDRQNLDTPYSTSAVNNPHTNEFHKPGDDDYYTHMSSKIDWVGLFEPVNELADSNKASKYMPDELRESFEKIYEECVCAGNGPGSISSFVPEHMRGVFCAGGGGGYGLELSAGKKVDTTDARRDSTPRATHKVQYAKKIKDGDSYLDQMVLGK